MVLYTDKLKVIHVSTHIALRKFLDTLSTARVETVIGIADTFTQSVWVTLERVSPWQAWNLCEARMAWAGVKRRVS